MHFSDRIVTLWNNKEIPIIKLIIWGREGMRMRILVVDDEPRQRKGLIDSLRLLFPAVEVEGAKNGEDALNRMREKRFDVLFSDIRMPGMDGLELVSRAYLMNPEVYTILVSVYADFEYAKRALELGAFGYILKPVSLDAIEEIMQKVFAKRKERQRRKQGTDNTWQNARNVYDRYILMKWIHEDLDEQEQSYFSDFFAAYERGRIFVMSVDDQADSVTKEERREITENIIDKIRDGFGETQVFVCALSNIKHRYWGIVPDLSEKVVRILERQTRETKKEYGVAVSFIVGEAYCDLEQFRQGYLDISGFCRFFFYAPFEKIWKTTDCMKKGEYVAALERRDLASVVRFVMEEKEEEIAVYFGEIFDELMRQMPDPQYMLEAMGNILMRILLASGDLLLADDFEILRSFIMELKGKDTFLGFQGSVYRFLYELLNACRQGRKSLSPVHQAILYIEKNYAKDLSLHDLAERFNYSSNYFSTLFKNETGENLVSYVNRIRLAKAEEMLKATTWSNCEIADRVGIHDYKYFNRLFKKNHGCSVSEYRKRYWRDRG